MLQEVTSPLSSAPPSSTKFLGQNLNFSNLNVKGSSENAADHIGLSTSEITHRKFVRYTLFSLLSAVLLLINFILFCVCLSLVIYRDATSYEWGSFIWVFYIFIAIIPLASFLECITFIYSIDKLLKLYVSQGNYRKNSKLGSLLHFLPYCYSFPILTKRNFYLKIAIYLSSIACFVICNLFVITAIILWFSIPQSSIPQQWWFIIIFIYSAVYSILFIIGWIIYLIGITAQKWWVDRQKDRHLQPAHSPSTLSTSTFPSVHDQNRIDLLHPITSLHIQHHILENDTIASSTRAVLLIHENLDPNNGFETTLQEEEHKEEPVEAAAPISST